MRNLGLTNEEAAERLLEIGTNELPGRISGLSRNYY
ncbi:MAG: cation-transporting P-type ATPase [Actinomycetales bacterium]